MKTNTQPAAASEPKPGNLSVQQLARSLTKTTPATRQPSSETDPETAPAPEPTREPTPAPNGEPEVETTDPSETESPGAEPAPAAEPAETEPTGEPETPDAEETPEAEPAPNVAAAVSERLNAELGDLITELKAAGEKGALQILKNRIPKLVDQRDTERNARLAAEEQNAQLRRDLNEARTGPAKANGQNGALHPEVAAVAQELANVDHWIGWAEENADGGEVPDGQNGKVTLNAAQVRALKRDMENQRTELVARKVQTERDVKNAYQTEFTKHHASALEAYPWLKNTNSPENQELQAILKVFPAFKQSPDYELAIGDFLAGKALREAKGKARAAAPALRRAAPSREPTRVVALPPGGEADREPSTDKDVKAAEAQFRKTGKTSDLAKWNTAKTRANRVTRKAA